MMYASSKDAIRKQLVGISAEIQATSFDEITFESGTHLFRSVCLQIAVPSPLFRLVTQLWTVPLVDKPDDVERFF